MDTTITPSTTPLLADRAYSISMVIKSFKGRRDVEVYLFRNQWDEEEYEGMDWNLLIGDPIDPSSTDPEGSKRTVLESFTKEERDIIINYLKEQYSTRLAAINSSPISFPVPAGLPGFTQVQAGKDIGFIDFTKIPSYPLDMPLKGLYNLSQHPPIVEE